MKNKTILELCGKRRLNHFLPKTHKWNGAEERKLIYLIKNAETKKDFKWEDYKSVMRFEGDKYVIYPNDTKFGTDISNSAPTTSGKTAIQALKNAWRFWSIPPFIICNSDYYVKGVSIKDVL